MFLLLIGSTISRRSFSKAMLILCAFSVMAATAIAGLAQSHGGVDTDPGDRGTGGKNTINGSVFYPGGRRFDRRVRVKLQSVLFGERYTMTDENGSFTFHRLGGGTYHITVDAGKEFETAKETVDIIEAGARRRGDVYPGQTFSVQINLQPKQSTTKVIATVDASAAEVPEAARELYKLAIKSSESDDRKKAIEQLNQALAIHPKFMMALNELGLQYLNLKQLDKAAAALRAALEIAPEAFHPRLNYGIVLLQMKNFKAAATELVQAVQKDSSSAIAHLYLGRALVQIGNYDGAEKALRQAADIGGDGTAEAHRFLGAVYIEKQDPGRAAGELEIYLKLVPGAKDADRIKEIVRQLRSQTASNKK